MNFPLLLELALVVAVAIGLGYAAALTTETVRTGLMVRRRMRAFAESLSVEDATQRTVHTAAPTTTKAVENPLLAWINGRFPLAGGGRVSLIVVSSAVLAFAGLTPFLIFLGMGTIVAVLLSLGLSVALGWNIGGLLENGKQDEFRDRFLVAMEDFQRMVRFGIPAMQALQSVGETAEEPLKTSMRNILLETSFGVPLEHAIAHEAHRIRMSELAMLAAIISTQATTGGNLSEAVGNLAAMLRERRDNKAKMKAATAESRVTLVILSLVPVLGIGVQAFMQPDIVGILLGEGRNLLGIGLGLIVAGLVMSWLMMRSAQR